MKQLMAEELESLLEPHAGEATVLCLTLLTVHGMVTSH